MNAYNDNPTYYQRTIEIKPIIESNREILTTIEYNIQKIYSQKIVSKKSILGQGTMHTVCAIGKIDISKDQELYLALRQRYKYHLTNQYPLAYELGAFEAAYLQGRNPPYFVCAIRTKIKEQDVYAMITEDLSLGKKVDIIDGPNHETCWVRTENYRELRFIDPEDYTEENQILGEKYIQEQSIIDLTALLKRR